MESMKSFFLKFKTEYLTVLMFTIILYMPFIELLLHYSEFGLGSLLLANSQSLGHFFNLIILLMNIILFLKSHKSKRWYISLYLGLYCLNLFRGILATNTHYFHNRNYLLFN